MATHDDGGIIADRFARYAIGQTAEESHHVQGDEVDAYARITGDLNPVHLDDAAARAAGFDGRIAHGMLVAGYVSATLATRLPGPGAIYLGQSLRFVRPVLLGDTVTTRVEILELFPTRRRIHLSTVSRNQHGKVVLDGEASVMIPKAGIS